MAIQFLDPISVLYLSHTHYRLRNILSSQQLWKALSTHWHKINYIEPGGDWKRNCFDREFIEACCPHLSTLNQKHVIADRSSTYQNFMLKTSVKCTHQDCQFGPQDIWFCLSENCDSVGCSRSKNKHALKHHEATRHLMTIRVTTLEAWVTEIFVPNFSNVKITVL
ncbi:hypothetical protein BDR26DRAFT_662854 [Obelidium mucronatum]|nr:hypothetical protein BDR26DRAFT_662854 [Obelidium mucronatum]